MSEEGEEWEESRKGIMSEKEGNIPALSGEGIVDPVGSPEEEGNLDTPVPEPHTITSYSSPSPFLAQV